MTTYMSFLITICDYKLWNCFDTSKSKLSVRPLSFEVLFLKAFDFIDELLVKLLSETGKSFLSSLKNFGVLEIFHVSILSRSLFITKAGLDGSIFRSKKILMQNYLNHHPIIESKVVASIINLSLK